MASIWVLLVVALVAAVLQYLDASVGMGFGEITALLIALSFAPVESVMSVILASAVLSSFAAVLHIKNKNLQIKKPKVWKSACLLAGLGIIAMAAATFIAVKIPTTYLIGYIALTIMGVGLLILTNWKKDWEFSWKRLAGFGLFASFNKGLTGGGYGPILATGQIMAGVDSKNAVGITALSEGVVSTLGFLFMLLILNVRLDIPLTAALMTGGVIGSPLAAKSIAFVKEKKLRIAIGIVAVFLGAFLIARSVFHLI